MAGDYQIMLPPNTTDPQLVKILQELLPEILMSRFGWDSMYARTLAEELAPAIVRRATECSQLQLLKDQPNSILVISPSPKHCDDLKKFLDDFLVVRGWPAAKIYDHENGGKTLVAHIQRRGALGRPDGHQCRSTRLSAKDVTDSAEPGGSTRVAGYGRPGSPLTAGFTSPCGIPASARPAALALVTTHTALGGMTLTKSTTIVTIRLKYSHIRRTPSP